MRRIESEESKMDPNIATEIAYKNGYEAGRKDALSVSKGLTGKKQYLIDEDTLKDLLTVAHYYAILERDGVDNWEWYMEGRRDYLLEGIREMPWHQGKSWEDLEQYIEEEGYMVSDLVNDEIEAFWEAVE
jgi:hypothetical protein